MGLGWSSGYQLRIWCGTQTQYWGESSSSTSLSSQQDVENDRMISFVLSKEYAKLDGAVGRCLHNLASVLVRILAFLLFLKLSDRNHWTLIFGLIVVILSWYLIMVSVLVSASQITHYLHHLTIMKEADIYNLTL